MGTFGPNNVQICPNSTNNLSFACKQIEEFALFKATFHTVNLNAIGFN